MNTKEKKNREQTSKLKCSWCKTTLSCKKCGADLFEEFIPKSKIEEVEKKLRKGICCPELEHNDDYCCMEVRGYNKGVLDYKKALLI